MKNHFEMLRNCSLKSLGHCVIVIAVATVSTSAFSAAPKKMDVKEALVTPKAILGPADQRKYQELTDAYEQNNFELFQHRLSIFRKDFPRSFYQDDAGYLLGMMQAGRKEYGSALKTFNETLKSYPTSNRVRMLLLSKGTMLKKMNLPELASGPLEQVKKRFPGSPEALRADVELKLLKQ